jgi:hypothetical protein
MENADAWKTCALNMGPDNLVSYEFNYIGDKPTAGEGGCLYVMGTNTGTTGGIVTNFIFYQEVTLQGGVPYIFDMAYKDLRTNNYWGEVFVGPTEPVVGSDYRPAEGATLIGGWVGTAWNLGCYSDAFDGTFVEDACEEGGTNPFTLEGTGNITVFIGIKMGICDTEAKGSTFKTFIDNVSLSRLQ